MNPSAGLFVGPGAAVTSTVAYTKAQQWDKEGRHPESIRSETGWFKNNQDEWRFEIDDSKATFKDFAIPKDKTQANYQKKFSTEDTKITLSDILDHNVLYKAYPELKDVPVYWNGSSRDGEAIHFKPSEDGKSFSSSIFLSFENIKAADGTRSFKMTDKVQKSLLHEIQHFVQARESPSFREFINKSPNQFYLLDLIPDEKDRELLYRAQSAEVEANAASSRLRTDLKVPPQVTEEFSRAQQKLANEIVEGEWKLPEKDLKLKIAKFFKLFR